MLFRCIAPLLFALALTAEDGAVRAREDKLALATYNEGAPDPNPQFEAFYRNEFPNYPYTIRTPVNKQRRMTEWRVLILENEYLSCRILPDLGGHLHGCTDRITGKEIFYANPAVRRTFESVRGAFIAMGIESSFPIAHSRVSASPVDFAWSLRDGIGRVVVEDTDRTSGMQWRDEFILRPGSAVLEQRVTLYNGSTARRGYHWWANAAIELDDPHLRVVYPVKWMLPHGDGPMTAWPIDDAGTDLSDTANHKTAIGLFAHASREPWMAIYKPKFRSGVAHYADPNRVKGKKIWLWGTSDTYVQQTLTENFSSYVEMQAGEFETQPEFGFLRPEESRTFTHYWIPFRDLGGISRATRDAVLNLSRSGKTVTIELNATHAMPGAKIRVSDGVKLVSEILADLDPKARYAKTLDAAPPKVMIDVIDARGTVVLHHVEGEYDSLPFDRNAKNPEPAPPTDRLESEAASFDHGLYSEQRDQWWTAWRDYDAGFRKSPGSVKLQLGAGRAAFVLHRYEDAIRLLGGMAETTPEAAYYFALALIGASQRLDDARAALLRAAKDPLYGPAARLQSALLAAREDKTPGLAAQSLQTLAAAPGAPARIGALEVALLRRAGIPEEAKKRVAYWLDVDPANDMLRVERAFTDGAEEPSIWNHLAADTERVLNLAAEYLELGAYDDALKILERRYTAAPATETEPGTTLPQENPLVLYYRGYCRLRLGQDPSADFRAASALSTRYVFPHRAIDFTILGAATAQNDADPVAHALLGDLRFASSQTDEAIAEWRKVLALKRDLPALHRNLGRALLEVSNEPTLAAPVLVEGRRLSPNDREIADALNRINVTDLPTTTPAPAAPAPKDAAAQSAAPTETPKGDVAGRALVRSAIDPDAAAALFNAASFPKDKQPDAVRRAYIEVQLQRLLARAYAGRCPEAMAGLETLGDEDTNVPFTLYGFGGLMKAAHFQYYVAVVESVCGDEKAAKKRWTKVSRSNEPIDSLDYVFPFLAAGRLAEGEVRPKLDAALEALKKAAHGDAKPGVAFSEGSLLMALGKNEEGDALLRKSLETGDSFTQYLSLGALTEASRK